MSKRGDSQYSSSRSSSAEAEYPGKRLGLPERGSGSMARLGRRILALGIDWGAAVLIAMAFFDYAPWALVGVFALTQLLFIPTAGGSLGHTLMGLRLVPVQGGYIGLLRPLLRTALLCLVIPAVIWDQDQRGVHDTAARTVLILR